MKRLLSTLLALTMALALVSCGKSNPTPNTGSNKTETPSETADTKTEGNVHIGIVTGSVSQSEDDRRGAEAFQALYGEDMVKLAIYPDNFTEELETTIEGESYDQLMEIVTQCQKVAVKAGAPSVSAYVKIVYNPEGEVLTIDQKITKHHQ